jgi:uncharacterized protein YbjT (DUF2867 family)
MAHVFIIGGAGQIARKMTPDLVSRGYQISSLYRHDEQRQQLADLGALPVKGDLMELTVSDLQHQMADCNIAVFAAGAGGASEDLTRAIDGEGLEKSVAAAQAAGVQRFYLISVFPEAGRNADMGDGFETYMQVKKMADVHLAASGLDFAIIRPGTLADDAPNGKVSAGLAIPYGTIPRADVAAFLAELIEQPNVVNTIIELAPGDTPILQAVSALAPKKV